MLTARPPNCEKNNNKKSVDKFRQRVYNKDTKKEREVHTMNTYTIYLGSNPIACIAGTEACYACYEAAKTIAEMTGKTVCLVWDETGEVVADYDPEED